MVLRLTDDGLHVANAQRFVDLETHLRELDRHIGIDARGVNPIQELEIGRAGPLGLFRMEDRFAEQVERDGQSAGGGIQLARGSDGVGDGLTGDEPRRKLSREPVSPDEAEDARLFAQPQEHGSKHQE